MKSGLREHRKLEAGETMESSKQSVLVSKAPRPSQVQTLHCCAVRRGLQAGVGGSSLAKGDRSRL